MPKKGFTRRKQGKQSQSPSNHPQAEPAVTTMIHRSGDFELWDFK
jgi:hypothetical protein